jgi:diguanylate cyclase (GGDEF)-like protein
MNLFWNIIASGLPGDYDIESLRKIVLINLITLLGCVFLTLLGILAAIQNNLILAFTDFFILCFLLGLCIYLRKSKNYRIAGAVGTGVIGVFYCFLFYNGGVNQTAFLWYYTYPLIALFLLGTLWGSIATFSILLSALVIFFLSFHYQSLPHYSVDLMFRFVPSYCTVYLFAFVTERVWKIIQRKLKQTNEKLKDTVHDLECARDELRQMALRDGLTGLFNRRYFDEIMKMTFLQNRRYGGTVGVIMFDIDFFKRYNDYYGHIAGDKILKYFAGILLASVRRETDMPFRYGGEEFVLVLSKTTQETIRIILDKIMDTLAQSPVPHADSPYERLTVSAGVAIYSPHQKKTWDDLIHEADMALYRAKRTGRNTYRFYNDELDKYHEI